MYPVIRGAGGVSPGSAANTDDTAARAATYTFALPSTAKAGDLLLVLTSTDSGQPSSCPVPTLTGHTFTLGVTSGGDSTDGLHGRSYRCELQGDGAVTVTVTAPNNPDGHNDTSALWLLLDGSTVLKSAAPIHSWNSTQIAATTSHTISSNSADSTRPGNTLAVAFLTNDAADSSSSRSYTAPSGWTKQAEVGSRQYLDSAIFTRTYEGEDGYASATATYGAAAVYTRMAVLVRGVPDSYPKVEHVASRAASALPGSGCWVDKPPGAAADDEASVFRFTGQSTARQRVVIQRFKGVHPKWPVLTGPTFGANTATASTSHVAPDVAWSPRSLLAAVWTTASPLSTYTDPAGFSALTRAGGLDELLAGAEGWTAGTSSGTNPATYGTSAVWNAAVLVLRAADDAASGVEVLVAWHSMDASQSSGTMDTPAWGGWTLLGTMNRVSTSGAANIKVYLKVVAAPQDVVWQAATDTVVADTTGLQIGYEGTQTQSGSASSPTTTTTGVPCTQAPGGRPGMACRFTIADATTRLEHNPAHRQFVTGDDYYFGFSFYLDVDFPLDATSWQVIEQLHGAPGAGSPVVAFEATKGQLRITGGANKPGASSAGQYTYDLLGLDRLERGRWYHVVYRVVFHDVAASSRLDAWVNGVRVLTNYQPPCATVYPAATMSGGGPSYRKQGLYHDKAIGGGTIWHGGSALGRSYAAVDPARTLVLRTADLVSDFTTEPDFLPIRESVPSPYGGTVAAYVSSGLLALPSSTSPTGTTSTSAIRTASRAAGTLAFTAISIEAVAWPAPSNDGSAAPSRLVVEAASQADGTRIGFECDPRDATLACIYLVNGSDASAVKIARSSVTRWWRIRNTGAFLIWETSPDGTSGSWTEQRRAVAPTWVNGKDHRFSFEAARSYAKYDTVVFDNLNVVPLRRSPMFFAAA